MTKRIFKYKLTRKLIVFALCFVLTGALVVVNAASPPLDAARMVMIPVQSLVTVTLNPVPSLTDSDLSRQLIELRGYDLESVVPRPAVVTKSKGSYVNGAFSYMDIPLSHELQEYTFQRCQTLGLEYEMVLAIMWRESRFQQQAVGNNRNGTQDSGLMQINDINKGWLFEEHGIDNLLDPYQNIDAGTAILAGYFSKYSENFALMAYQYGEQGMLAKAQQGMETNALTEKVQAKRNEYKAMRLGA